MNFIEALMQQHNDGGNIRCLCKVPEAIVVPEIHHRIVMLDVAAKGWHGT